MLFVMLIFQTQSGNCYFMLK